ncbi:MAG: hypothetical protein DMG77_09125 [Acidobacteria bacterium]|nr:MAG: hypothetical protein DMG77_09125 [Acidobacteriota bacterium]
MWRRDIYSPSDESPFGSVTPIKGWHDCSLPLRISSGMNTLPRQLQSWSEAVTGTNLGLQTNHFPTEKLWGSEEATAGATSRELEKAFG